MSDCSQDVEPVSPSLDECPSQKQTGVRGQGPCLVPADLLHEESARLSVKAQETFVNEFMHEMKSIERSSGEEETYSKFDFRTY